MFKAKLKTTGKVIDWFSHKYNICFRACLTTKLYRPDFESRPREQESKVQHKILYRFHGKELKKTAKKFLYTLCLLWDAESLGALFAFKVSVPTKYNLTNLRGLFSTFFLEWSHHYLSINLVDDSTHSIKNGVTWSVKSSFNATVFQLCHSSGQSYKAPMIVIYDSRVVPDLKLPHITTLES